MLNKRCFFFGQRLPRPDPKCPDSQSKFASLMLLSLSQTLRLYHDLKNHTRYVMYI